MSLHILDTDTLTLFQDGHATVCKNAKKHPPNELAITVLSVEEQLSGWDGAQVSAVYLRSFRNMRP